MSNAFSQFGEHLFTAQEERIVCGKLYRATVHANFKVRRGSYALVELNDKGGWQEYFFQNLESVIDGSEEAGYLMNAKWVHTAVEDLLENVYDLNDQED